MAMQKISDWGKKGYVEYRCEIETEERILGTKKSESKGVVLLPKNKKNKLEIDGGWIRGFLTAAGRYMGISGKGLFVSGLARIANLKTAFNGNFFKKEITGAVEKGRGTTSIYEGAEPGVVVSFDCIMPRVSHPKEKDMKKHLEYAGKYCGMGAMRGRGYGLFKVLKVKKIGDVKGLV